VAVTVLHLVSPQLQVLAVVAEPTIRLEVIPAAPAAEVVLITQVRAADLPDKAIPEDQVAAALVVGAAAAEAQVDLAVVTVHQEQGELVQLGQELAVHMPAAEAEAAAHDRAYLQDGQADQEAADQLHLTHLQETELLELLTPVAAVAAYLEQAEAVTDTAEQAVQEL
jgi:hypothetical protein